MAKKSTSKLFQEDEVKEEMAEGAMNEPIADESTELFIKNEKAKVDKAPKSVVKTEEPVDDVQDIDLSIIKKKRFRVDGDNSKILELNVSDMGIATRLKEAYPRLNKLMDEVSERFGNIPDEDEVDEDTLNIISEAVDDIDAKMRKELDYIFNANVSDVCGRDGSMWDPIEGSFRYEHIIETLAKLYENNLDKEVEKMKRRVADKTAKYTKYTKSKRK